MRRPELDYLLTTMLDSQPEVSDLLFTVDKPLQVESFGELRPVACDPPIAKLTPFQPRSRRQDAPNSRYDSGRQETGQPTAGRLNYGTFADETYFAGGSLRQSD